MLQSDLLYKIGITLIPGVGDVNAKKLIAYCGGVEAVFLEKQKSLLKIPGIGLTVAESILKSKVLSLAEKEIEFIEQNEIKPLFYLEKDYPERLKHCNDSPLMLYYKGNCDLNASRVLGIVGTRKATEYGKDICHKIVEGLAHLNVIIVSGLAFGIDVQAHKAALQCGLNTIGVLGHGLDMMYPSMHLNISQKMMKQGGLLTDYRSGSKFMPENFPKRNRIVAGMVDAIMVIEAAKRGGALITAEIANSYNRDVFAVPGRVGDIYSEGCINLIKTNKAMIVGSAQDIIYNMGWQEMGNKKAANVQKELFMEFTIEEQKIVDMLNGEGSISVDMICINSGLPVSKTAAVLLNLELKGIIKSLPGKKYQLR